MTGPLRRSNLQPAETGLNYTAINATASADVVTYPPEGFRSAEYRHRIGSGADRFDRAGRALMTWGALRGAGFAVDDVRAEQAASTHATPARFLDDGTPWITPGMTATVSGTEPGGATGPVKVVTVIDEPGRIGYVFGSMPGHEGTGERFLQVEHDDEDSVWVTLRSIWQAPDKRFSRSARTAEMQQRRVDERIVRSLHPSYAA